MFIDFVLDGQVNGPVANALFKEGAFRSPTTRWDPGIIRPYYNENGEKAVTLNTGKFETDEKGRTVPVYEEFTVKELMRDHGYWNPVFNATSLSKESWIQMDQVAIEAARPRLRFWGDLAAANTYGGFNGMNATILEHETMSDPGSAAQDMNALSEVATNDAPKFQLEGLPLVITHSDFFFDQRTLGISQNKGMPLDTTQISSASRRVAEMVEGVAIGTITGLTYGGQSTQVGGYGRTPTVYGLTNFPSRVTKTGVPTPTGSNADAIVDFVLAFRDDMYNQNFYGPFIMYHSTDWDKYMDDDYSTSGGNNPNQTLRGRLRQIEGIQDVRRLDLLTSSTNPYTLILVQQTPDVARAVNGMDLTTVTWVEKGGMKICYKIMCIWVPQFRADFYGKCGVGHATPS